MYEINLLLLIILINNVTFCDDLLKKHFVNIMKLIKNVLSYGQELGLVDGQRIILVRSLSFK